jgi:vitamin B12 transporter
VGYQINSNQRVEATALTSYMNAGYDASQDHDDRSIYKMNAVGLNWLAKWSDVYSTRLQYTQSRDFYQTKPSPMKPTRVCTAICSRTSGGWERRP